MNFFRNFTAPLWEIFSGNLLLLFCSLFYLAWWAVSYRPNSSAGPVGGLYLAAAFIMGVAAIALMSGGVSALSQNSKGLPVRFILLGGAAMFLVLIPVTTIAFHRIVTSELIIIHIWAVLELCMLAVLLRHRALRRGPCSDAGVPCFNRLRRQSGLLHPALPSGRDGRLLERHGPADNGRVRDGGFPGGFGGFISSKNTNINYNKGSSKNSNI